MADPLAELFHPLGRCSPAAAGEQLLGHGAEHAYKVCPLGEVDASELANAASWAVELAQIVPGVMIVITDVFLLTARLTTPLAVVVGLVALTPFVAIARLRKISSLHVPHQSQTVV